MALGMVGGVGLCIDVVDFGSNRRRGRGSFWGEFGRSMVTNGKFDGSLCGSARTDGVVAWGGE